MAPHEVISMMLRQPVPQHLEAAAAVAGARDGNLAVYRDAPLVLDRRNKPSGIRVARMSGDRETEFRRADGGDFLPVGPGVFGAEDAVVVLAPHHLGLRAATRQPVDVLRDWIVALLGRHVFGIHAAIDV